jgi:hypothetical protein
MIWMMYCLLIYYTCDVNICGENGSWPTYAMHSILPLELGVTEALHYFKTYKVEVENQLERKIKRLKSDRGGEYF